MGIHTNDYPQPGHFLEGLAHNVLAFFIVKMLSLKALSNPYLPQFYNKFRVKHVFKSEFIVILQKNRNGIVI